MRRATIVGLVAAASMSLSGCAVPHDGGLPDVRGTWRLQTESGDATARISVHADHTYTAHAIPAPIACGTEVYSGSPPGCADGRDAVDFSGTWKLSDDEPRELRLYSADLLVRKGYRDRGQLGFYIETLDAPRPDYVFVRMTSTRPSVSRTPGAIEAPNTRSLSNAAPMPRTTEQFTWKEEVQW